MHTAHSPMKTRAFSSNGFANNLYCQQPRFGNNVPAEVGSKENFNFSIKDDYTFHQLEKYCLSEQCAIGVDNEPSNLDEISQHRIERMELDCDMEDEVDDDLSD